MYVAEIEEGEGLPKKEEASRVCCKERSRKRGRERERGRGRDRRGIENEAGEKLEVMSKLSLYCSFSACQ